MVVEVVEIGKIRAAGTNRIWCHRAKDVHGTAAKRGGILSNVCPTRPSY